MLRIDHLNKSYGSRPALSDVSTHLRPGEVVGLLGVNGAGKSTLMNIITGCLAPGSGTVLVDGHDIVLDAREAKRRIGYLPERCPLYEEMTVAGYLAFVCRLREVRGEAIAAHVRALAEKCAVADCLSRRIGSLSKGYKQRVGLTQALCGDSRFLVLDEPTAGLDPVQSAEFRSVILSLRGGDRTILFSSHILSEVQSLCDRVLILHGGRLIADRDLTHHADGRRRLCLTAAAPASALLEALRGLPGAEAVTPEGEQPPLSSVQITCREGDGMEEAVFSLLSARHYPIYRLTPALDSLESIFLRATGTGEGV